jgi:hypothetical protein
MTDNLLLQPILDGDELQVDLESVESKIEELGKENIVCFLAATSCFAPRAAGKKRDQIEFRTK